jgi:hypothetical protein
MLLAHMHNHHASFWSSLLAVVLAAVCFCAAYSFQVQHRQAERAIRRAVGTSLPASPTSEKYLLRAWWMFYAATGVCAFAVVMAAKHKYWLDWLCVVVVVVIALAIPFVVIWVI